MFTGLAPQTPRRRATYPPGTKSPKALDFAVYLEYTNILINTRLLRHQPLIVNPEHNLGKRQLKRNGQDHYRNFKAPQVVVSLSESGFTASPAGSLNSLLISVSDRTSIRIAFHVTFFKFVDPSVSRQIGQLVHFTPCTHKRRSILSPIEPPHKANFHTSHPGCRKHQRP